MEINYCNITLVGLAPPPEISEIERFETTFNLQLPIDYREFLLRIGGGVPSPRFIFAQWDESVSASQVNADIIKLAAEYEAVGLSPEELIRLHNVIVALNRIVLPYEIIELFSFGGAGLTVQGLYAAARATGAEWARTLVPIGSVSTGETIWMCVTGEQSVYVGLENAFDDDMIREYELNDRLVSECFLRRKLGSSFTEFISRITHEEYRPDGEDDASINIEDIRGVLDGDFP